jgi:hypothetical protein
LLLKFNKTLGFNASRPNRTEMNKIFNLFGNFLKIFMNRFGRTEPD